MKEKGKSRGKRQEKDKGRRRRLGRERGRGKTVERGRRRNVGREQEKGNNQMSGLGVREECWGTGREEGMRRGRGMKVRESKEEKTHMEEGEERKRKN